MASLKQIKIFPVRMECNYQIPDMENDVNKFIVDIFNKTGSYPNIKTNSKYIAVIYEENNIGNYSCPDTKNIMMTPKPKPEREIFN